MRASFAVSSAPQPVLGQRAAFARTMLLTGALLGTAMVGGGCELPPATAVAVSVKVEPAVSEQLLEVTFRVFEFEDDPDYSNPVSEFTTPIAQLSKPFIVTRAHADRFLLSVEGFVRGGGDPAIVYREQVTFKAGKTLALPVFLASACFERTCQFDGLTCYGAAHGGILAGQCDRYPERELEPVERPGDESKWEPVPTKPSLLDAGFRPVDPDDYYEEEDTRPRPRFDGGSGSTSCSTPTASRSCLPGTLLDASVPMQLDRQ